MEYMCLRTCYTSERLYHKGAVYDLPDAMRKSEKNFQLVGAEVQAEEVEEVSPLAGEAVEIAPLYLSDHPKKKKAVRRKGKKPRVGIIE